LGGLSTAGDITFNPDGSLVFPEGIARGDVTLTEQSRVNVTAGGGGFINVNARNLVLSNNSELFAGIAEDIGSVDARAGDITINATESVRLIGSGGIDSNPYVFEINDYDTAIRNFVGLRPNNPDDPNLGRNPKFTSTAIGNAGNITINTNLLQISDRAAIIAKTYGQGDTGNITVSADSIEQNGGDFLNQVRAGAVGNAGNIDIETTSLSARNVAFILSDTEGRGNGGNITINAAERVLFDGTNNFNSDFGTNQLNVQVQQNAVGNGGNIEINTKNFALLGDSSIFADTRGRGNAGNITINATERVLFDDTVDNDFITQLNVQVQQNAVGNGGNIEINTKNFSLLNGSRIFADLNGIGNAGKITINADETVTLANNSSIFNNVGESGSGNAGNINIDTQILDINNGSIYSFTKGEGNAGNITINADKRVSLNGSNSNFEQTFLDINNNSDNIVNQLNIQVANNATGNGGNLTINTGNLSLASGYSIVANTSGNGNAGNVIINADNISLRDGSTIFADTSGTGDAGDISINTQTLNIQNASIFSLTSGRGNAGDITIKALETVTLDGSNDSDTATTQLNAQTGGDAEGDGGTIAIDTKSLFLNGGALISAETTSGEGGNITFNIDRDLTLDNSSRISAQAFNNANGGNININTGFIIAFPDQNNDIIANAQQGEGGNIAINADSVFGIQERSANDVTNDIDASSQFGLDGTISIFTPDVNAIQRDADLPSSPIESQQTVAEACRSNLASGQPSGLIVKGKGGIAQQPIEPLNSDATLVDGRLTNANSQSQHPEIKPIKTSVGDIYPARGVIVKENGDVILTAYPTDGMDTRTPNIQANCS
jgi:large exoprotein involved in heme utilization and adhesion